MKVGLVVSTTTALVATTGVVGFAPFHPPRSGRASPLAPLSSSITAALPNMSNPYRRLPWIAEREERRELRRLTVENAALFRELGLPQDATYEDVDKVTKHLIALTEGLPKIEGIKKRIKVEIARDKIYQIRLNERITGVRNEQIEAAVANKWDEGGIVALQELTDSVDDIIKPKKAFRIPLVSPLIDWGKSIYVPPDEAWRTRQLIIWGGSSLVLLLLPAMVEQVFPMSWLPAGGIMGFRGMPIPEGARSGYNPFRGRRNKKNQLQAMCVAVPLWALSRAFAFSVVAKFPVLAAGRSAGWYKFAIVQGALGTACCYIQTYKGEENNPDMI